MFPRDLTYDSPYWAYLLLAILAILGLFWMLFQFRQRVLAPFMQESALKAIVITRSNSLFWLKAVSFCLAWIFAAIALMQPKGNGRYPEEVNPQKENIQTAPVKFLRKAHDVIFLLDASASMEVTDTRLGNSRLSYAKGIIDTMMDLMAGENVSLYVFTSQVSTIVPPTLDYFYLRMMLEQVKTNEGDVFGTDLDEAMAFVHDEILAKESKQKLKTLIILSDGEDNQFEDLKDETRDNYLKSIVSKIKDAADFNTRVFSIGIGSREGGIIPDLKYQGQPVHSSMDDVILKALSHDGRGKYYQANEYTPLLLATDLFQHMKQDNPYLDAATVTNARALKEDLIYDLYYQFPLGIAVFFLWLAIRLPSVALSAVSNDEKKSHTLYPEGLS